MRGKLIVFGVGFMAAAAAGNASAQSGYYDGGYYGGAGNSVRCESNDGRMVYCGGGRDAQLQRQVSQTPCVRGQTWGTDNRGLWVRGGCRGEFLVGTTTAYGYGSAGYQGGTSQVFRCESSDKRTRQCTTGGLDARLVRQLSDSPCVEGQSWGRNSGSVWVSRGCRGEFQLVERRRQRWDRWGNGSYGNTYGNAYGNTYGNPGYGSAGYGNAGYGSAGYGAAGYGNPQTVRCESQDGRTRRCEAYIDRGVQVIRQLSSSPCVEGQNWGWDRSGVWVSGGCRAEFNVW